MGTKCAPALLPALGLLAGALAAARLVVLPGPTCVVLAALGLALKRPAGAAVAGLAVGLLHAQLSWTEPAAALPWLHGQRPVEVAGRVVAHPVQQDGETLLRIRTRHVTQGQGRRIELVRTALDVFVTVPPGSAASGQAEPSIGSTVRLKGFLRRSAGFANTDRIRPGTWRLRLKSAAFLQVVNPPGAVSSLSAHLRRHAEVVLGAAGGSEDRPGLWLARALLLGDRSALPAAWRQTLRRLGLTHLLAVSGLHVGLLALLVLFLAGPLPRTWRYAAALLAVAAYLLLIGPRPAVLRASIMGLLALGALLAHRPPQSLNALAWGAAVLVLASPAVVTELGFQLSFAATAALIVLSPIYAEAWRPLPKGLRRALAASFAAQLATWPLLVPYTGSLHPLAPFLNLVAIPWLAVFLLVAFPCFLLASAGVPHGIVLALPDLLAAPLELASRVAPGAADLRLLTWPAEVAAMLAAAAAVLLRWPRRLAPALLAVALLCLTGAGDSSGGPAELLMQHDGVTLSDVQHQELRRAGGAPDAGRRTG